MGSRIRPSRKGKRANVKRQKSSIFRASVHVDKEGEEIKKFPRVLISYNDFYIDIWKLVSLRI